MQIVLYPCILFFYSQMLIYTRKSRSLFSICIELDLVQERRTNHLNNYSRIKHKSEKLSPCYCQKLVKMDNKCIRTTKVGKYTRILPVRKFKDFCIGCTKYTVVIFFCRSFYYLFTYCHYFHTFMKTDLNEHLFVCFSLF